MLPSQIDSAAVSLAAIAIISWVMKFVLTKLTAAIEANTQVTQQTYEFLVNLNGELKAVVKSKRKDAQARRKNT